MSEIQAIRNPVGTANPMTVAEELLARSVPPPPHVLRAALLDLSVACRGLVRRHEREIAAVRSALDTCTTDDGRTLSARIVDLCQQRDQHIVDAREARRIADEARSALAPLHRKLEEQARRIEELDRVAKHATDTGFITASRFQEARQAWGNEREQMRAALEDANYGPCDGPCGEWLPTKDLDATDGGDVLCRDCKALGAEVRGAA